VEKAYCVLGTKARRNYKYGYVIFKKEETIDLIPFEGVQAGEELLSWTCHKHKLAKRKLRLEKEAKEKAEKEKLEKRAAIIAK
jgi:hypothetical protein